MKVFKTPRPPRWATSFLRWYCRQEVLEDLEGDLHEYFQMNVKSKGKLTANIIYILDVFKFVRSYTVKSPKPRTAMNQRIVLHYFTTSIRNISRNKLFAAINITGLAVSMCVSLLLISLIIELNTFDDFHSKAERIFRVNNILKESNGSSYNYATTSVLTGKKIKESVPGIEEVVILKRGFNKDISANDKVVPLNGLWADESFFRVFSFKLIYGNPATVLKEPNTIVLTKSSAITLFDKVDIAGELVAIDSINYLITGVVEDPPMNSHMKFDMLGSFITIDGPATSVHRELKWDDMWDNYVYILLTDNANQESVEKGLSQLSNEGNETIKNRSITLYTEALRDIATSRNMSNSIGQTIDKSTFVTFGILAGVVLISACFNYTNLSVARALRRTREVGIRKVVGASRWQVFSQFVLESITLALLSLGLAYILFLILRPEFLSMNQRFQEMVTLKPTFQTYLYFIGFAVFVGIVAGIAPASFFSKINPARILKDFSSVKLFDHINFRKALIVFQYTLSILFIVAVSIGYKQYRYSLAFNLGFETENIFSIRLQGNESGSLIKDLSELPEVKQIAHANHVLSIGANSTGNIYYAGASDSSVLYFNFVDDQYLTLHQHKLLAGENFKPLPFENQNRASIIINLQTVRWMQLPDPHDAVGEELMVDGEKYKVLGVIEDFHYERVNYPVQNFAFRFDPKKFEVLNLKLESADITATAGKIEAIWKKNDKVHPFSGRFYDDYVEAAYDKLSWIIKIVGFIAILTISIAFLGLLGMVIYTTERRLREISIRKVFGASEFSLLFLMSKSFLVLLLLSAVIAIPLAYHFMNAVIFEKLVNRAPIEAMDLLFGTFVVMIISIVMICAQTLRAAKSNPSLTLKVE